MYLFRATKNYLIGTWHRQNKNNINMQNEDYREVLKSILSMTQLESVFEFTELYDLLKNEISEDHLEKLLDFECELFPMSKSEIEDHCIEITKVQPYLSNSYNVFYNIFD